MGALFKRISSLFGVDIQFTSLIDQAVKTNALNVTSKLLSFLFDEKWTNIYTTKDYAIFVKSNGKPEYSCLKIPFKIKPTHRELVDTFSSVYEQVKDKYSRADVLKKMFGDEKVDRIIKEMKEECENDKQ